MSDYCLLNRLPVELLHTLLGYFSAQEILRSFYNVSDYVDAVLLTYNAYRLNFKSIRKIHFDLVCCHIRPEQVISLTLSDADDTPGQSELYLSRVQIEQFTNLRSLTLLNIEYESFKFIFSNLHKLDQLCSLSYNDKLIRHRYSSQNTSVHNHPINNINTQVLCKLNRLSIHNDVNLMTTELPHLRHLKLEVCSSIDLTTILEYAPQLKSLCTCVLFLEEFILPPNQLFQLNLEIKNHEISIREMTQLFSKSPHLKHLELKAKGMRDIADGYQWEMLTNSLITFIFKFELPFYNTNNILDSYRTPFWLEEKHWYVAFQYGYLFSVPHFLPVQHDSLNPLNLSSTAPDHAIMLNHPSKFKVNSARIDYHHRLTQIKHLIIEVTAPLEMIKTALDLNQVEHLIVSSLDHLLIFTPMKCSLPQLNKLTVINSINIDMIKQIRHYRFEQILQLEISVTGVYSDYIIEELFHLFPYVRYLIYKSPVESEKTIVRLIDGFGYLSNASFCVTRLFMDHRSNINTIIQRSQRLIQDNFIYRIYHSSNNNLLCDMHWWIGEDSSAHLQRRYWLPRRGYNCGQEILFSFYDISNYINAILQSYSDYKFNFKSITKFDFDFIHPQQFTSLNLKSQDG